MQSVCSPCSLCVDKSVVNFGEFLLETKHALPGESKNSARRLKKLSSLNITLIKLKAILFYSRYVQLGSAINPALIGHSFQLIGDIYSRMPLSKTCKNE